jgi:hypothetical protein
VKLGHGRLGSKLGHPPPTLGVRHEPEVEAEGVDDLEGGTAVEAAQANQGVLLLEQDDALVGLVLEGLDGTGEGALLRGAWVEDEVDLGRRDGVEDADDGQAASLRQVVVDGLSGCCFEGRALRLPALGSGSVAQVEAVLDRRLVACVPSSAVRVRASPCSSRVTGSASGMGSSGAVRVAIKSWVMRTSRQRNG